MQVPPAARSNSLGRDYTYVLQFCQLYPLLKIVSVASPHLIKVNALLSPACRHRRTCSNACFEILITTQLCSSGMLAPSTNPADQNIFNC